MSADNGEPSQVSKTTRCKDNSKYHRTINVMPRNVLEVEDAHRVLHHYEVTIDAYAVMEGFSTGVAELDHALKKLLAPGERGSKDIHKDLDEVIWSINMARDRLNMKAR